MKTVLYELIADFPCSLLETGDRVAAYEDRPVAYVVGLGGDTGKCDMSDYPHLFRKVQDEN